MPAVSTRARNLLLALALGLTGLAPVALTTTAPQPTVALSAGDGAGAAALESTSEVDGSSAATTTTIEPPSTTTTTTAVGRATSTPTASNRLRSPIVYAERAYDYTPVGTPLSGPVELRIAVRDTAGAPVAGACISVRVLTISSERPVLQTRTGADGVFEDGYHLPAMAHSADIEVVDCSGATPAFARRLLQVDTKPGNTYDVPVLVERRGATVVGTLFGRDYQPIPHACVYFTMREARPFGVLTDAKGVFVGTGLPVGQFSLIASPAKDGTCGVDGPSASYATQPHFRPDLLVKQDGAASPFMTDHVTEPGAVQYYKFYVAR